MESIALWFAQTPYSILAGQFFGLVALILCLLAFSSKQDERLMVLLLAANTAFGLQFIAFQSWTAAVLTGLVMVRIVLARRYPGSKRVLAFVLSASLLAAVLTWQSWIDLAALVAMILGTVGMFMLRGIPMRVFLLLAACFWALSNFLVGSVGGLMAELLVVFTSAVTIIRLYRIQQRYA